MTGYDFSKMCPRVAKHIQRNNGAFDVKWMERHMAKCRHCQSIMRLVNGTIMADFRREVGGEDTEDKLSQN